ncbi:hypothetical protein D3C84_344820 [compost metagenome]
MLTGSIRGDALVQCRGGVIEQLRRPSLDLRWLGTLRTEGCRRLGTFGRQHLGRRLARQVGKVVGLLAFCRCRVGTETGDVGGQVPTLPLVELISERRHVRALNALPKGAVDRVEAQAVLACAITQVRGRRLQANACGAIASAAVAVAHRAVLCIQRYAPRGVRGNDRGLADLVGHCQFRPQLSCLTGDARTVLAFVDSLAQGRYALLQLSLLRLGRQRRDKALQRL